MLVQLNSIAGDTMSTSARSSSVGMRVPPAAGTSAAQHSDRVGRLQFDRGARRHLDDAVDRTTATSTAARRAAPRPATSSTTSTASATPVPATESSAAALPIGAVVGPAGLPTLPYTLKFTGGYFDIANFIGGVDDLVQPTASGVRVTPDGRLFTVDGFALNGGLPRVLADAQASFAVTTYATPADQGLTLGASPSGPAPAVPGAAQAQPASAVVAK